MRHFWVSLILVACGGALGQSALELEVLQRTNAVRTERGLRALQWDALAYKAALGHARDMLERRYFAHDTPEGLGAGDRMRAAGVLEYTTGENLASYQRFADATIPKASLDGWMNSPGHRANLLRPEFTHLGVALLRQGDRVMVVQNFLGRPFDPRVEISPAQVERTTLSLDGTAPGTLGVFVDTGLWLKLNPPISAEVELPPKAKVAYALFDGKTWWEVKPGQQGVRVNARMDSSRAAGVQVRLALPAGNFVLALGSDPRQWQSLSGPANLELSLASSLEVLWLGVRKGGMIDYTHRIPLK